ncbi:MAG TPA: glycosyl transferase [Bdellovibrionales bacterium]|nr:MAG: hypothetical protein A2Z97_12840 [Bdellovibrionales bacterium GWB1_52_6]OFZ02831.1 MAG: hypothetical protein A2X97_04460 [Bdellovibrionales bacterium GWA1_52_35]OFZ33495.1 MAG: hypothetical protein A2070_14805 [Bdellovibrionales bacterium GWC1_52_8]HAR43208.1 glycosyl transferase [Bdellovibrionales bacterium]HCM38413.1 glycosyl transferase [Bdellovibrionales bacterium]
MRRFKGVKRVFDLLFVIPGLIVLVPVFVGVAVLIKLEGDGPVFFRQTRVGYKGKLFKIWKFRTMYVDAEKRGLGITVGQDPRITRAGRVLRKLKLDELPQLVNVLLGEMSLVGPRPELLRYVEKYTDQQRAVLLYSPGITDPASIQFRNESEILAGESDPDKVYIERIMPEKIRINLHYATRAGVFDDLAVIFKTIFAIAR